MTAQEKTEQALRTIVTSICRKTPSPEIRFSDSEFKFYLKVEPCDQGRCVGKKGIVIWAISTVMHYIGVTLLRVPISLKLIDQETKSFSTPMPFKANPKWDRKAIQVLIDTIITNTMGNTASWVMEETGEADATVMVRFDKYVQGGVAEPNLEEAIEIILRCAGLAHGCMLKTEITWK